MLKAEAHFARQREIISELERDTHPQAAEQARKLLPILEGTVKVLRDHVRLERELRCLPP